MPLPRFHRLPEDRRDHLLAVATERFARDGVAGASYNQIITAMGVSKTAAYQYFDGREDLLEAVLGGVEDRLVRALGPWPGPEDAPRFWDELRAGWRRLAEHLSGHPDDAALAGAAARHDTARHDTAHHDTARHDSARTESTPHRSGGPTDRPPQRRAVHVWLGSVVDDGRRLGVIRRDLDPELLLAATEGALRGIDAWALGRGVTATGGSSGRDDAEQAWELLAGLWGTPAGLVAGGGR